MVTPLQGKNDGGDDSGGPPKSLGCGGTPSDLHILHLLLQHLVASPPRLLLAPPFLLLLLLLGDLLLNGCRLDERNQLSQVWGDKGPLSPPRPRNGGQGEHRGMLPGGMKFWSFSGTRIPSGVWWFSRMAQMVRVVAHMVAFSICTNSTCGRGTEGTHVTWGKQRNTGRTSLCPLASPCPSSSWSGHSGCAGAGPGSRCSWNRRRARGRRQSQGTRPPDPVFCWLRGSGSLKGGQC